MLTLVLFGTSRAQSGYHFTEEFYFIKEIPVTAYQEKNFRYEIAVRANPTDTISKVHIHGVAVGQANEDFLFSDFKVESRQEQEWTIYTVIGKVDQHAWKLWFYAGINGNGHFFFDDINCYIEDSPGKWKQLRLFNSSFEEKSNDIFKGYFVSKQYSSKVRTAVTTNVKKSGKQSLHVQTRSQKPVIETSLVKK